MQFPTIFCDMRSRPEIVVSTMTRYQLHQAMAAAW